MKSTTKENIGAAILIMLVIAVIITSVIYEYVKFQAYWRIAFGN